MCIRESLELVTKDLMKIADAEFGDGNISRLGAGAEEVRDLV
jgi:hypothetical protein